MNEFLYATFYALLWCAMGFAAAIYFDARHYEETKKIGDFTPTLVLATLIAPIAFTIAFIAATAFVIRNRAALMQMWRERRQR